MRRGGWRQHVRAELQRREERSRGLRTLLERYQELRERLEARQPGRPPALQVHLQSEAVGVQREREELRQQVALLADLLRRAEAESREQRARMGRLARDLAALTRQHEEAECRAWSCSAEAEGLRKELDRARGLLQEAEAGRLALETRWLGEKALEASRVNRANEQEEKQRRKVMRLREKLARAGEQAGLPCADLDRKGGSFSTSSEEAEPGAGRELADCSPTPSSPSLGRRIRANPGQD